MRPRSSSASTRSLEWNSESCGISAGARVKGLRPTTMAVRLDVFNMRPAALSGARGWSPVDERVDLGLPREDRLASDPLGRHVTLLRDLPPFLSGGRGRPVVHAIF